jgi:hypothetical protein
MLFAFGTLWFWLLIILTFILITTFVEKEEQSGTGATIILIISVFLIGIFGNFESFKNIFNYAVTNPWTVLGFFALYVVLGIVWSFFKWYFYLSTIKEEVKEKKENCIKFYRQEIDISLSVNKNRVIVWMSYWPFSIIWTLINDPIKKLYRYILHKISGLYQKISDRMFKEFNNTK